MVTEDSPRSRREGANERGDRRGRVGLLPGNHVRVGVERERDRRVTKAQGATVDATFLLGDDRLFREAGYVALSRGRQTNRLYLVADAHLHANHDARLHPADPLEMLRRSLTRSGVKALAVDAQHPPAEIAAMRRELEHLDRALRASQPRTTIGPHLERRQLETHLTALAHRPRELTGRLDELTGIRKVTRRRDLLATRSELHNVTRDHLRVRLALDQIATRIEVAAQQERDWRTQHAPEIRRWTGLKTIRAREPRAPTRPEIASPSDRESAHQADRSVGPELL